jgi:hypothetical protein
MRSLLDSKYSVKLILSRFIQDGKKKKDSSCFFFAGTHRTLDHKIPVLILLERGEEACR